MTTMASTTISMRMAPVIHMMVVTSMRFQVYLPDSMIIGLPMHLSMIARTSEATTYSSTNTIWSTPLGSISHVHRPVNQPANIERNDSIDFPFT